ncbi:hypothetical protein Sru01_07650 [Sphaerisporangium rufum]|uniref:Secreted protein n=1 Tax=Sphaerisporangium rufum TaxID=1381558 RepID=A0A919QXR7_9ACTN|nr:hypothetical protein [Sphaerisporangium rufum]GII75783.1 hypothetical protein Sru01_07650 [Sphaerisporangium rufum]
MHRFLHTAGTALAGMVIAGAGFGLPAAPASAAARTAPATGSAVVCPAAEASAATRPYICFLRYCDPYWCYYDCYPTYYARKRGDRPSTTIRQPRPAQGRPPAEIRSP